MCISTTKNISYFHFYSPYTFYILQNFTDTII
ncbi:hypothetical protein QEG_2257, partial [Clostridioides difficile CD127]